MFLDESDSISESETSITEVPFVLIRYGPYEANGVVKYRPQRLHGVTGYLNSLGIDYTLEQSDHPNRVSVQMKNREVFRCDIRNLCFNMDWEEDIVCQRLVDAVVEASSRMNVSHNKMNHPVLNSVRRTAAAINREKADLYYL